MRRTQLYATRSQSAIFLQLLKEARIASGRTQVEMARRLGVTQGIVSKCESGARRLQPVELWNWLRALNLSIVDFVAALDAELQSQTALEQAFTKSSQQKRSTNDSQ
jgi:transcriptional regulator with XRE-family HTH domain